MPPRGDRGGGERDAAAPVLGGGRARRTASWGRFVHLARRGPDHVFGAPRRGPGRGGRRGGGKDGAGLGAPGLRGCVSGGAAAEPGFRESFEAICRVPYVEHYGSTEAGPVTMAAPGEATASGACGRVLPGTRVRVGGGPTAGTRVRASCGSAGPGSWPVTTSDRKPPRRCCATAGSARVTWSGSMPPVN
ncbi:AMP-binding protein [Streptomyces sp. NPDC059455]|uniref:AMP-binding protein n=1 Tax=Streptomyces sp. NPDC059455 TaxID=3346837 RepID=UPI003692F9A9